MRSACLIYHFFDTIWSTTTEARYAGSCRNSARCLSLVDESLARTLRLKSLNRNPCIDLDRRRGRIRAGNRQRALHQQRNALNLNSTSSTITKELNCSMKNAGSASGNSLGNLPFDHCRPPSAYLDPPIPLRPVLSTRNRQCLICPLRR
jgi:hypothetical protein